MGNQHIGLIDNWIRHIKDVYRYHHKELDLITEETKRFNRFVELNVVEQVCDLAKTSIVQSSWENNHELSIHGWVYDVGSGLVKDLEVNFSNNDDLGDVYQLDFLK
jgi:carbonic anhydrase